MPLDRNKRGDIRNRRDLLASREHKILLQRFCTTPCLFGLFVSACLDVTGSRRFPLATITNHGSSRLDSRMEIQFNMLSGRSKRTVNYILST